MEIPSCKWFTTGSSGSADPTDLSAGTSRNPSESLLRLVFQIQNSWLLTFSYVNFTTTSNESNFLAIDICVC